MFTPKYLYVADAESLGTFSLSVVRYSAGSTKYFFLFPSIEIWRLADFPLAPALIWSPLLQRCPLNASSWFCSPPGVELKSMTSSA